MINLASENEFCLQFNEATILLNLSRSVQLIDINDGIIKD